MELCKMLGTAFESAFVLVAGLDGLVAGLEGHCA